MDRDFQQHTAAERTKVREQTLHDFNNEMAGRDTGRVKRFPTNALDAETQKKRDQERDHLNRLSALMRDPAYRDAYDQAENTIDEFKTRMDERLQELDDQIEELDEKLETAKPGTPEYERLREERLDLQRRQQDYWDYYYDTIQPFEDRMNDPDNPPSRQELDDFNEKVQRDMEHRLFEPSAEKPSIENRQSVQVNLPTLG